MIKTAKDAKKALKIGFIGQGYVGKNYADDFEKRGFSVVRYALEEPYRKNKKYIQNCDIVFIAVPTPTTSKGFSYAIVDEALSLVKPGKIAVIKSTILPGTTERLQKKHPKLTVLFSPEFLGESTAAHDVANPFANVIGLPKDDMKHRKAADLVFTVLPRAPYMHICSSSEAELIKYAHNTSGYVQIVLFNLFYDLAMRNGADWDSIHKVIAVDPYICNRYSNPIHKSGRGAGGHCFIKDFAAIRSHFEQMIDDAAGLAMLQAIEAKNIELLAASQKDMHLVAGVYGRPA
jgi:nucleotide sugar dehydrogenase